MTNYTFRMAQTVISQDGRGDGRGDGVKRPQAERDEFNWARVSEAVRERRAELHWTQEDVKAALERHGKKTNIETYRRLERGEKSYYRLTTLASISIALDWPPATLYDIALGADVPLSGVELDRMRDEVSRLRDEVADLRALAAQHADLLKTVEQLQATVSQLQSRR